MKRIIGIMLLGILSVQVCAQSEKKGTVYEYIATYKAAAVREMYRSRIPASITLAQGILESSNGNSRLAKEANNHFGIKCKKSWTGRTLYEDDDEAQECFRAYESAEDSYRDHSDFLMKNTRYAFLFDLSPSDYQGWAKGLKSAGYATNPNYAPILIDLIERHKLFELDKLRPEDLNVPEPAPPVTASNDTLLNRIPAVRVGEGANIPAIARQHDMMVWQIYKYNDLKKGETVKPGEILYLKPKRRKAEEEFHVVKEGETMRGISQQYGIKLKQLYKKNRMKTGTEPVTGEKLYMRQKSSSAPDTVNHAQPQVKPNAVKPQPVDRDTAYAHPRKPTPVYKPKEQPAPEANIANEKVDLHTVQPGETLFNIAKRYQKSVQQIQELNNMSDYSIRVGQKLIINGNIKEAAPDVVKTDFVHVVKSGETLYSISRLYNMSVDELKNLNKLEGNSLSEGTKLYVSRAPQNGTVKKEEQPVNGEITHVVKKGDTIFSISRTYGVSVDQLRKLNSLNSDSLSIGQVLKVRQ